MPLARSLGPAISERCDTCAPTSVRARAHVRDVPRILMRKIEFTVAMQPREVFHPAACRDALRLIREHLRADFQSNLSITCARGVLVPACDSGAASNSLILGQTRTPRFTAPRSRGVWRSGESTFVDGSSPWKFDAYKFGAGHSIPGNAARGNLAGRNAARGGWTRETRRVGPVETRSAEMQRVGVRRAEIRREEIQRAGIRRVELHRAETRRAGVRDSLETLATQSRTIGKNLLAAAKDRSPKHASLCLVLRPAERRRDVFRSTDLVPRSIQWISSCRRLVFVPPAPRRNSAHR